MNRLPFTDKEATSDLYAYRYRKDNQLANESHRLDSKDKPTIKDSLTASD